jgi:hypothetical protein
MFRSALQKARLTLTVDCTPLLAPVHVDKEMWEKILLDLLSNAFKHMFTVARRRPQSLRWAADPFDVVITDLACLMSTGTRSLPPSNRLRRPRPSSW